MFAEPLVHEIDRLHLNGSFSITRYRKKGTVKRKYLLENMSSRECLGIRKFKGLIYLIYPFLFNYKIALSRYFTNSKLECRRRRDAIN